MAEDWREEFARLEQRIESLERRRPRRLNGRRLAAVAARTTPRRRDAVRSAGEDAGAPKIDFLSNAGRALIVLGGAYLFRAISPDLIGVALALLYALFWLGWNGRTEVLRITGAFIAFAVAWESATRFQLIDARAAAAIVGGVAIIAFFVARRHELRWLSWAAAVGASGALVAVAIGTRELAPSAVAVAVVAVVYTRCKFEYVQFAPGVMLDLMLIVLTATTAIGGAPAQRFGVAAIVLGALTLYFLAAATKKELQTFDSAQLGALVLIALIGTAILLLPFDAARVTAGVLVLVLAGVAYMLKGPTFLVLGITFALFGSALALGWQIAAVGWAIAAVVLVTLKKSLEGTVYAGAAFAVSGLFVFTASALMLTVTKPSMVTISVFALIGVATVIARRLPLILMSAAGVAAMLVATIAPLLDMQPARVATLRTILFAATALLFARFPRTRALVHPVLIAGAVKLIAEDFRVGSPATLFISLAIYGGALVFAARMSARTSARVVTTS